MTQLFVALLAILMAEVVARRATMANFIFVFGFFIFNYILFLLGLNINLILLLSKFLSRNVSKSRHILLNESKSRLFYKNV